jgi:ATP-dependent Clp protease ATP-binding subunit ClpC
MFERFTERARKVVVLAQEEARHFNHNYIGTEHLLLGLRREEDDVEGGALARFGVDLDAVREQVESIVGYGQRTAFQFPLAPRSKKILEMALLESKQLDHHYVGAEHILLGLAREGQGVANRILDNLGVDQQELYREVQRTVRSGR